MERKCEGVVPRQDGFDAARRQSTGKANVAALKLWSKGGRGPKKGGKGGKGDKRGKKKGRSSKLRVLEADFAPIPYDPRDTVLRALCGEKVSQVMWFWWKHGVGAVLFLIFFAVFVLNHLILLGHVDKAWGGWTTRCAAPTNSI